MTKTKEKIELFIRNGERWDTPTRAKILFSFISQSNVSVNLYFKCPLVDIGKISVMNEIEILLRIIINFQKSQFLMRIVYQLMIINKSHAL